MRDNKKFQSDDLVAVVWPRQSEPRVRAGELTWEQAAREAWAMDPDKADRVRVLIAVFEDKIVGSWAVTEATHHAEIPEGKSRTVSRSRFHTIDDGRLKYLVGADSPRPRQRNPQATFELRDLDGAEHLVGSSQPAAHGLVRLGKFVFTVSEDGRAELRLPPGATLTVRAAA